MPAAAKPARAAAVKYLIKPYREQGFREAVKGAVNSSGEVLGNCVLCGKEAHFCVNETTGFFSCKRCGAGGGVQEFLTLLHYSCEPLLTGDPMTALCRHRGLSARTFRAARVGYNPFTDRYLIPIWRLDARDRIYNLHRYKLGDRVYSSAGCDQGLLGWEDLSPPGMEQSVYIGEGDSDWLALRECLAKLQLSADEAVAVGVPGAGTFKGDWVGLFEGKNVIALYDNDEAGRLGAQRAFNLLSPVAKTLLFVHWEQELPSGYDFRDLYKYCRYDARKTIDHIHSLLSDIPPGADGLQASRALSISQADKITSTDRMPAEEVYRRYREYLYIPERCRLISIVYGTAIANRRDGDPVWMFIVGPPSSGKTEILMSISQSPLITAISTITPTTLISGASFAGGADPSLIPQLDGRVLVIKDFTTILNMMSVDRDQIFSILREAYDGKIEKRFGNGVIRRYKSKFGVLAGVTPAIEQYSEGCVALGERFLQYWLPVPKSLKEQRKYLHKARENEGKETSVREALQEIAQKVLSTDYSTNEPELPKEAESRILSLAQLTAVMRGVVPRDKFSKEVTHHGYSELAPRLTKEFLKLNFAIAQFHCVSKCGEEEYQAVREVAYGSVPSGTRSVIRAAWEYFRGESFDAGDIARKIHLPATPTVSRILQNLASLRITQEQKAKGFHPRSVLRDEIVELVDESKFFDSHNI